MGASDKDPQPREGLNIFAKWKKWGEKLEKKGKTVDRGGGGGGDKRTGGKPY